MAKKKQPTATAITLDETEVEEYIKNITVNLFQLRCAVVKAQRQREERKNNFKVISINKGANNEQGTNNRKQNG